MKTREEIIKEFLKDEEKVQAMAKDEEFVIKVSEGKATSETYKEEFKKFGLELTDEEATRTADMIDKIQNNPPEELDDLSLGDITGGNFDYNSCTDNYKITEEMAKEAAERRAHTLGICADVAGYATGGIVCAGLLVATVGGVCGYGALFAAAVGNRYELSRNDASAAKWYNAAIKLSWMFPKEKAKFVNALGRVS